MKHAAVAIDYEQRIASLEADNRALQAAVLDLLTAVQCLRAEADLTNRQAIRRMELEAGRNPRGCR